MEIVFASANKNKISEIKALLPASYRVYGLEEIGISQEIPEPGETIKENSYLKAKFVYDFLKGQDRSLPVFADDSGLEVQALGGRPGVYSARYAGLPRKDEANNSKLLRDLEDKPDRHARFVTVITLLLPSKSSHDYAVEYFEGEIRGTIGYTPRGNNGFGYDPLFIPTGSRSTFAQMDAASKNAISHRGLAVKQLLSYLNNL